MHDLLVMWFGWVQEWGYWGVIILMAMESSIFPVPSEVVVPPAAMLAADPSSGMTLWGVIAAGTFGSWLGSAITYAAALWLGRPLVLRYGKYFFMPAKKVEAAEVFLAKYEVSGIFFARLLPVIRHLISIPAGLIKMRFGMFSLVTSLGAFIWCAILGFYGHSIGQRNPELLKDPEALVKTIKHESLGVIIAIAVLCVLFFVMKRLSRPGKKTPQTGESQQAE